MPNYFLIICIFYYFYFKGRCLYLYDDFTHWGPVVKILLYNHHLPTAADTIIWHQSYPTGTAGFVYLCCTIAGDRSDGMMMASQMILLLSCLLVMFAFVNKRKPFSMLPALAACGIMLEVNIAFRTLLVDNVLCALCFGGLCVIYYEREQFSKRWGYLIPIAGMVLIVKNAGIYYFILILVAAAFVLIKEKGWRTGSFLSMILLCFSCTFFISWNMYLEKVMPHALNTRHSLSLQYLLRVFNAKEIATKQKTVEEFFYITWEFFLDERYMVSAINCGDTGSISVEILC